MQIILEMTVKFAVWLKVQGARCRVQGSGFRVHGSGFWVQGSEFRVRGSGFRVQGSQGEKDLIEKELNASELRRRI